MTAATQIAAARGSHLRLIDGTCLPSRLRAGLSSVWGQARKNPGRTPVIKAPSPKQARKRASHYKMARDLAGTMFPVSEAVILAAARKHGIGRKMGRAIIFSPEDVQRLYEELPCSDLSVARKAPTGSYAAPSGASALKKARALLTNASQKKSVRSVRAKFSTNQSTVVPLPQRSRKPH
jgi:hypothetical protein